MNRKLSEIATLTGGVLHGGDAEVDSVLTDSRSLVEARGTLFVALTTPSGDGHHYISWLYEQGVRMFMVREDYEITPQMQSASIIKVADTLVALQSMAVRDGESPATIIAITGSRGKTDMKEWLSALLAMGGERVTRSPRSFNSQIGVPLSMLQLDGNASTAVIEAGISCKGEMLRLAEIIKPDMAIFTTIDSDHDEGFASRREKGVEKSLLASLSSTRTIFYNRDSEEFDKIFSNGEAWAGKDIISYSSEDYDFTGLPMYSDVDRQNAAGCVAVLRYMGVDEKEIRRRLMHLAPVDTRLNVSEGMNGCSVIYDGYTSDIGSLSPAIDFMRRRALDNQSYTLILGDLDDNEPEEAYRKLAKVIFSSGIGRFIGIGPSMMRHSHLFAEGALFYESSRSMLSELSAADFRNEIILVKGMPGSGMRHVAERLEARTHETVLEVNLDALAHNLRRYRERLPQGTKITAMVKANAYGLGSFEVSRTLQEQGADYLAVAVLDEGIELRRQGITMPIMVMNPKVVDYRVMFQYRLEPEIYTLDMLADVVREAKKHRVKDYPVHIKLDTGMHRMGFVASELARVAGLLKGRQEVRVASVFSHLATADCLDMDGYTLGQIDRFKDMTGELESLLGYGFMRHILNSAGMVRFPEYAFDMGRLGIGLYGVNTLGAPVVNELDTVASLRTVIISLHSWDAGEAIGYGRKGLLEKRSSIATIPIGYADGMNRRFGNGAIKVLVNGKEAPTIGNICMDACMIDVTGIECSIGDTVEIFGAEMPLSRLSDTLGTIPYEILTSISPRVKRVYYRQ